MIKALYSASSGMVAQAIKQDTIANNIANAQTPGFKREKCASTSFQEQLDTRLAWLKEKLAPPYPNSPARPVKVAIETMTDNSQGPISNTGNKLDFAIEGPGMFEVVGNNGTKQVRAGNFTINSRGELCTQDGAIVQGNSGAIVLPKEDWSLAEDGSIIVNGRAVDKIKIVGEQAGQTRIRQGCLEMSNCNIVSEMVSMISNVRAFEANQKVIMSVDQTLERLMSVGNV